MQTHYVPFSLSESGMLSTILLSACRSLLRLEYKGYNYNQLALSYKGHCIKTVNDALSQEARATSDATIGIVLSLAADDVSFLSHKLQSFGLGNRRKLMRPWHRCL